MKEINRTDNLDFLFNGILNLESLEDAYMFFSDLCTPFELQEMSQRMQAAKMLREGMIYSEIAQKTGLSTATISRVNRCLRFNDAGYEKVLRELDIGGRRYK